EDQATGRAHRFGQKNVVQVIRLITEGTIEEKIYDLQQKKRELIDQVIRPGETMLSSLSEDDVRELLSLYRKESQRVSLFICDFCAASNTPAQKSIDPIQKSIDPIQKSIDPIQKSIDPI